MSLEFNRPGIFDALKIHESVTKFAATLPPDSKGGLATVATDKGVNAIVFKKFDNGKVEISAWIGKSWGEPIEDGVSLKVLF